MATARADVALPWCGCFPESELGIRFGERVFSGVRRCGLPQNEGVLRGTGKLLFRGFGGVLTKCLV